jgi:hypothetical protein
MLEEQREEIRGVFGQVLAALGLFRLVLLLESGTHQELPALKGTCSAMFSAQAKNYNEYS